MSLASLPRLLRDDAGLTQAFGNPSALRRGTGIRRAPSRSRRSPNSAIAARCWSRPRPEPTPASSTTTCASSCRRTRSCCSPRGRRCRSSGSARASRRWAGGWTCCGACAANKPCRRIIVAGVRALLQRLSPEAINVEPIRIRPNDVIDPDELLDTLIGFGYRREDLVEHRGEVARRGAIIDVFPSTADSPIRIDLWGDEVDRLTEFTVNDQRSTDDLEEVHIFPARELLPSEAVRASATDADRRRAVGPRAVGAPGRGNGLRRHGELAAVAGRRRHADHRSAARHPARSRCSNRGACATAPTTCWPRRTTWPARWRRRGHATPTASSRACTPTPTDCSTRPNRCGRSARRRSIPTRRWCKRRAGDRSSATAKASPSG